MGNCGCKGQHKDPSQQTKDFVYTKPERQHYHYDGCEDKKHEYFDKYSTLEKQLVAENLGMSCNNTTIQNYPDEEDLTQVVKGNEIVLKFKDKLYDPDKFSGYGRVFLRKNIVSSDGTCGDNKKNILTQDMFKDKDGVSLDHTIFVIQYDYDLNGQFIEIPCNGVLLFAGGSLTNGTIILNGALVLPFGINIDQFILCSTRGKYAAGQVLYKCGKLLFFDGTQWYDLSAITSIDGLNAAVKELTKEIDDLTLIVADLNKKISDDYIINLINKQLTTLGYLTKNDLVGYATKEYVNSLIKNIDLTPLEAKVYANEVDIAGLKSRVSTNESNISSLGTRVTKLENIKKGKLTFTGAVSATYDGSSDLTINIPSGGSPGTITVDSALSTTSTNPVQNKVITGALNKKLEASDFKTVGGESIIGTGDIPFPDPGTGSYVLPVAADTKLGGVKIGYTQNDKNYPLQLDDNDKAYVNIPWTGGSGGSTTKYVPYFKNSASTTIDSKLALPTGFSTAGLNGWSATNANPTTAAPYTWICQVEITDGAFVSAIGPWRITPVDGGSNGTDGTDIEFIFALSNDGTTAPLGKDPVSGVTKDITSIDAVKTADFVPNKNGSGNTGTAGDWQDDPMGVSTSYKYEWCSLRTSVNGTDGKILTYTKFIKPFIWSAYGETGTDGDGVEYVFIQTDGPSVIPETPTYTSTVMAGDQYQEKGNYKNIEFIPSISNGASADWTDNPTALTVQGRVNWVSIRKKLNGIWGAFSEPTIWTYYSKDGSTTTVSAAYSVQYDKDILTFIRNIDANNNIVYSPTQSSITFKALHGIENASINSINFDPVEGFTITKSDNILTVEINNAAAGSYFIKVTVIINVENSTTLSIDKYIPIAVLNGSTITSAADDIYTIIVSPTTLSIPLLANYTIDLSDTNGRAYVYAYKGTTLLSYGDITLNAINLSNCTVNRIADDSQNISAIAMFEIATIPTNTNKSYTIYNNAGEATQVQLPYLTGGFTGKVSINGTTVSKEFPINFIVQSESFSRSLIENNIKYQQTYTDNKVQALTATVEANKSSIEQTASELSTKVEKATTTATSAQTNASTALQTANGFATRISTVENTTNTNTTSINTLNATANTLDSRITTAQNGVVTATSEIKQLDTEISGYVKKGEEQTSVTLTEKGLTLNTDNTSGTAVNINNKFIVSANGDVKATNATVTGDITANTLNIALSTNSSTVTDASSLDDSTIATLAANGSMAFKNTSGSLVAFFSYEGAGVYLYMKNPETGKWYRVDFLKWKQCSNSVSSIAIPLYSTTQIQSVLGNSISPESLIPTTTIYKALETKNSAVKGFVYTDSDCTTLVTSTYLSNYYLLSNSFEVLQKSFGTYYLLSGNYKYINAILKGGSTQTTAAPGITHGSTQYIIGNQWLNANATTSTVSTASSNYQVLYSNGSSYAVSSITLGQKSFTLSSALTCDSYVNDGTNNFVPSLTEVSTSIPLTPVTFNATSSTTGTLTENTNIFDSTYVTP